MSSSGRIENEEAYQRSLDWLVKKSIELEDPLLGPEERAKLERSYDFVTERVREYRRGELVQMYPGLRETYKILGWYVQELAPPESEPAPDTGPPVEKARTAPAVSEAQPAAKPAAQPPKKKAPSKLSGWLDD